MNNLYDAMLSVSDSVIHIKPFFQSQEVTTEPPMSEPAQAEPMPEESAQPEPPPTPREDAPAPTEPNGEQAIHGEISAALDSTEKEMLKEAHAMAQKWGEYSAILRRVRNPEPADSNRLVGMMRDLSLDSQTVRAHIAAVCEYLAYEEQEADARAVIATQQSVNKLIEEWEEFKERCEAEILSREQAWSDARAAIATAAGVTLPDMAKRKADLCRKYPQLFSGEAEI